jgi:hypothetical protein
LEIVTPYLPIAVGLPVYDISWVYIDFCLEAFGPFAASRLTGTVFDRGLLLFLSFEFKELNSFS